MFLDPCIDVDGGHFGSFYLLHETCYPLRELLTNHGVRSCHHVDNTATLTLNRTIMLKRSSLLMAFAGLLIAATAVEAAPIHKCVIKDAVTYQQAPCPSNEARKEPTLEELNAGEKKRRAAAERLRELAPTPAPTPTPSLAPAPTTRLSGFSCDARKHCTQMRSCEEAKYFLAHCPGVKMDGDGDGIPCEEQLCGH